MEFGQLHFFHSPYSPGTIPIFNVGSLSNLSIVCAHFEPTCYFYLSRHFRISGLTHSHVARRKTAKLSPGTFS